MSQEIGVASKLCDKKEKYINWGNQRNAKQEEEILQIAGRISSMFRKHITPRFLNNSLLMQKNILG